MKNVKRILGLILVSMMLMAMVIPAWAADDSALAGVTRRSISHFSSIDATFLGDKLNLDFDGVTFTSSDSDVIDPATGAVTRPEQTKNVILTASKDGETKDFAFRIPGKFEEVRSEKFLGYNDTLVNLDGNASGFHSVGNKIYLTDDESGIVGKGKIEFYMTRSQYYRTTGFFLCDTNGVAVAQILWVAADAHQAKVEFNSASAKGGSRSACENHFTYEGEDDYALGSLTFTMEFDTATGAFKAWVNGVEVNLTTGGYFAGSYQDISYLSFTQYNNDSKVNLAYRSAAKILEFGEVEPVAPVTFYQDSFDGEGLPATITSGNAEKATGAITPANNFEIALNESLSEIDGQVNLDFTISRPASVAGDGASSMDIVVRDGSGKRYVSLLWWGLGGNGALASTYSANEPGDGAGSGWDGVGGDSCTSLAVKMTIDTKTKAITLNANGVVKTGYALDADVSGVAGLYLNNYQASKRGSLADINCYGVGTYDLAITHYKDTLDSMPTSHIGANGDGGATSDGAGAIKMGTGYFYLNMKEDGSNVAQDATLDFTMMRFYGSTCSFSVSAADGTRLAYFQWNSGNYNTQTAPFYLAVGTGAESQAHTTGYYEQEAKITLKYVHATKEVSVYFNGTLLRTGTAADTAGGIGMLSMFNNGGGGNASDYMRLKDVNCYSVIPDGGGVSGDSSSEELGPKPEVSGLTVDFNAYDQKVNILSGNAGSVTVIAAAYAGEGDNKKLISAAPATVTLAEDGTVIADTSDITVKDADSVVIYLWNSLNGLQPAVAATVVNGVISAN